MIAVASRGEPAGPLRAGIVWLGLYPAPVLHRMEAATVRYLELTRQDVADSPVRSRLGGTVEVQR